MNPKRRFRIQICLLAALASLFMSSLDAQAQAAFEDYFTDAALRLELFQTGGATNEIITLRQICFEPVWPGSTRAVSLPYDAGQYSVEVRDKESDRLIYSRGFGTMFAEFKKSRAARAGAQRTFEAVTRIPCPKKPVRVVISGRDRANALRPMWTNEIDPADFHINRESVNSGDWVFEAQKTGDPHDRVDVAFLAEGYTAADKDKFRRDVDRFAEMLFSAEPFKSSRGKFNVYGIFRASPESGADSPRLRRYKSTALDASFNTFDVDGTLLVPGAFELHRMAAQAPYDMLAVLVNDTQAGSGGVRLDYCACAVDSSNCAPVFLREFAGAFAFLALEFPGQPMSESPYVKGVEPVEPNITALLVPGNIKWKALLSPGIAVPTDDGVAEAMKLRKQQQLIQAAAASQAALAKAAGKSDEELAKIDADMKAKLAELTPKVNAAMARPRDLAGKAGAFEGAGYMPKGMYRPGYYCLMGVAGPNPEFCPVCRNSIQLMIDYYAGGKP